MDQGVGSLFGNSSAGDEGSEENFETYRNLANVDVDDETFQLDDPKIRGRKYLPEKSDDLDADHGLDDLFEDVESEVRSEYGLTATFVVYRSLAEQAEEQGYVNGKQVYQALERLDEGVDELDFLGT
jgi:hypothetical protein